MAEFKINPSFSSEIESLRGAGTGVVSNQKALSLSGISTLPAAQGYETQRKKIMALLSEYKDLLVKEANDLQSMMDAANQLDQKIAGGYGGGGGSAGGTGSNGRF